MAGKRKSMPVPQKEEMVILVRNTVLGGSITVTPEHAKRILDLEASLGPEFMVHQILTDGSSDGEQDQGSDK